MFSRLILAALCLAVLGYLIQTSAVFAAGLTGGVAGGLLIDAYHKRPRWMKRRRR